MTRVLKDKVKKRKIDWCQVIYNLGIHEVWNGYHKYVKVSRNRSAYYLLKSYFSTSSMRKAAYLYRTEGLDSCLNYLRWFDEFRKVHEDEMYAS